MTKEEAISQMMIGKKLTHRFFINDEWIKSDETGKIYKFDDGSDCTNYEFWIDRSNKEWDSDWEIFK